MSQSDYLYIYLIFQYNRVYALGDNIMNTWASRKWGTHPVRMTKYDITKTRDMQQYLNNSIPMQSDKLKIRLIEF